MRQILEFLLAVAQSFIVSPVLFVASLTFSPSPVVGAEVQSEPANSIDRQLDKIDKILNPVLNAPVATIPLKASNIKEYRITHENNVKLVLRQPEKEVEFVTWPSRTFDDATEFIQLLKKGGVRLALVKHGWIFEVLLEDKAFQ